MDKVLHLYVQYVVLVLCVVVDDVDVIAPFVDLDDTALHLSLIHISEPTRPY